MAPPAERHVELVHHVAGRTRFRVSWIADEPDEARRIASEVAELPGVTEVRVRPRTGSVLCLHEPALGVDALVRELGRITKIEPALGPATPPSASAQEAGRGSAVGVDAMDFFRALDRDVYRVTEGRLDLATLAVVAFAGVGSLSTAATGELPLPPWYSLAWWSFRVLWTVERPAVHSREPPPPARARSARRRAREKPE